MKRRAFCRECNQTIHSTEGILTTLENVLYDPATDTKIIKEEICFCCQDCKDNYINESLAECDY